MYVWGAGVLTGRDGLLGEPSALRQHPFGRVGVRPVPAAHNCQYTDTSVVEGVRAHSPVPRVRALCRAAGACRDATRRWRTRAGLAGVRGAGSLSRLGAIVEALCEGLRDAFIPASVH